jgi:hypothetical protein
VVLRHGRRAICKITLWDRLVTECYMEPKLSHQLLHQSWYNSDVRLHGIPQSIHVGKTRKEGHRKEN